MLISLLLLKQASAPPAPGAASQWTKHTSPDGRPYWSKDGQSVWEKPDDLKTPVEREMSSTGWKEYETGGRKYWVKGSETTWNMPQELTGPLPFLLFRPSPNPDLPFFCILQTSSLVTSTSLLYTLF